MVREQRAARGQPREQQRPEQRVVSPPKPAGGGVVIVLKAVPERVAPAQLGEVPELIEDEDTVEGRLVDEPGGEYENQRSPMRPLRRAEQRLEPCGQRQ